MDRKPSVRRNFSPGSTSAGQESGQMCNHFTWRFSCCDTTHKCNCTSDLLPNAASLQSQVKWRFRDWITRPSSKMSFHICKAFVVVVDAVVEFWLWWYVVASHSSWYGRAANVGKLLSKDWHPLVTRSIHGQKSNSLWSSLTLPPKEEKPWRKISSLSTWVQKNISSSIGRDIPKLDQSKQIWSCGELKTRKLSKSHHFLWLPDSKILLPQLQGRTHKMTTAKIRSWLAQLAAITPACGRPGRAERLAALTGSVGCVCRIKSQINWKSHFHHRPLALSTESKQIRDLTGASSSSESWCLQDWCFGAIWCSENTKMIKNVWGSDPASEIDTGCHTQAEAGQQDQHLSQFSGRWLFDVSTEDRDWRSALLLHRHRFRTVTESTAKKRSKKGPEQGVSPGQRHPARGLYKHHCQALSARENPLYNVNWNWSRAFCVETAISCNAVHVQ